MNRSAEVRGERNTAMVHAARSMQSRVSSVLAAALMLGLGLSALTWYYAHALTRGTRARQAAESTASTRARGEMPLPPLARIGPLASAPMSAGNSAPVPGASVPEPPIPEPPPAAAPPGSAGLPAYSAPVDYRAAPSAKSTAQLALERRLSGKVLARSPDSADPGAGSASGLAPTGADSAAGGPATGALRTGERSEDSLARLLGAAVTPAVQAQLLPTQRFLLPQGSFIDCTLETAIDSTLPGMTTCITATDTFGADGKVVLLERGTKLVGETRGQVEQGQSRVFVLWTQARTPGGVVVPLASPGTDELGRAGLPGEVQRHFWERFGAAMLISLIDGAVQAGVQASARNGGTIIYAPSASQDVLTEVLKSTVSIAPTVIKQNGDRIQVLVARDLDFRSVYELRVATAGR